MGPITLNQKLYTEDDFSWFTYSLFLLLCLALAINSHFQPGLAYPYGFKNPLLIKWCLPLFKNKLITWDKTTLDLMLSYVLGIQLLGYQHPLNLAHQNLYLAHLLSPSAFHLIGISWLLETFFEKSMVLTFWVSLLMLGWWVVPLHPAMLRSIGIVIILLLGKNNSSNFKLTTLLLFFIVDYGLGTYQLMPLSYVFSFIILGHFVFLPKNFSILRKLFISQLCLAFIFSLKIQILQFYLGQLLSIIFLPIFTLIITYVFLVPLYSVYISNLLETFFNLYLILIQKIGLALHQSWHLSTSENLIMLSLFTFVFWVKRKQYYYTYGIIIMFLWPINLS